MIERYSRPELAALWDDKHRFELWLSVELAACRAMERAGTVPEGTADRVGAAAGGNPAARRDPFPDPRRGARRRARALAPPRHDVVRRARYRAGAADRPGARPH